MATILCIETSTSMCSAAIAREGKVLMLREEDSEKSHASMLSVFIDEILNDQGIAFKDINAVAVSRGPGSYTGLRIGVSTAKGICYASDIPLISVCTLQAMAGSFAKNEESIPNHDANELLFCPMMDARRMEVYCGIFNKDNELKQKIRAEVITEDSFLTQLENRKVLFFGNGSEKCKEIIRHPNAIFVDNIKPSAADMAPLAEDYFIQGNFENTAYFSPYYLKDFVATIPRNRL